MRHSTKACSCCEVPSEGKSLRVTEVTKMTGSEAKRKTPTERETLTEEEDPSIVNLVRIDFNLVF